MNIFFFKFQPSTMFFSRIMCNFSKCYWNLFWKFRLKNHSRLSKAGGPYLYHDCQMVLTWNLVWS